MEFLQGMAVFYAVKIIIFLIFLLIFLLAICVFRRNFKKKIAIKIINNVSETAFFILKVIVFLATTAFSVYCSREYLLNLKINLVNQYALIYSSIEVFRFSYQEYKNFFSLLDIREILYKYIKK